MEKKNNEYTFCFINGGWWMKIEDVNQLIEYTDAHLGHRFGSAVLDAISNDKEVSETPLAKAIALRAENSKTSLFQSALGMMQDVGMGYYRSLKEDGFVLINPRGGYNSFSSMLKATELTVKRDKPIFPHYTKADIRIKTWENTDKKNYNYRSGYKYHYYAYLGDMQITDGDKMKWDTKEEAYAYALKYVEG